MSNEKSNPIYFQTPKIMTDHPKITGAHIYIFMPLYDQLRQSPCDKTGYNKTNEYLSEFSKESASTVKRKINDLEEWGFLSRAGMGHNRKFFLGKKFNNGVNLDLLKDVQQGHGDLEQGQIDTSTGSKTHYIAKNVFKNKTKKGFAHANSNPKPHNPSYQEYAGRIIQDVKYGRLPDGTKPMTQEEFEGTGGASSVGALISCVGGSGGAAMGSVSGNGVVSIGGIGGTGGSGGDVVYSGNTGGNGIAAGSSTLATSGSGAGSYYNGAPVSVATGNAGTTAVTPGAGGSGGAAAGASRDGGAGAPGYVTVVEFIVV